MYHFDPTAINVQRLVGRAALCVHAGYPSPDLFQILLGKFTLDGSKWLPAATVALALGLTHARLVESARAREQLADAERMLQATGGDYVQRELTALRVALSDTRSTESDVDRLLRLLSEAGTTRGVLHHELDKIMVRVIWQREQNVARTAKRLKMGIGKVSGILRELGLI